MQNSRLNLKTERLTVITVAANKKPSEEKGKPAWMSEKKKKNASFMNGKFN